MPEQQLVFEDWWEGGSSAGSITEESDYDSGYLNLGAETPSSSTPNLLENAAFIEQWAAAGVAVPKVPVRRPSWRLTTSLGKGRERSRADAVDRDCGICFEHAVVPCRTLCCGKIFCTEHLADWLHGPNAEGRCPNCENTCSLEDSTLSLVPPSLIPSSRIPRNKPPGGNYHSSPLITVQSHHNDTLHAPSSGSTLSKSAIRNHAPTPSPEISLQVPTAPTSSSNFSQSNALTPSIESSESTTSISADTWSRSSDDLIAEDSTAGNFVIGSVRRRIPPQFGIVDDSSSLNFSTTPFAASWGAVSRLLSIITFLMFLYKLAS